MEMKNEMITSEIRDIVQKLAVTQPIVFESVLENIDNDIYFLADATGKKVVLRETKRTHQKYAVLVGLSFFALVVVFL